MNILRRQNGVALDEAALTANQQMLYLFLAGFGVLFIGMGLFPVLPLYAARFGASSTFVGIFYALMYLANALGPVFVGWTIGRFSGRTVFLFCGVLGIPVLFLLGFAASLWQIVILAALLWFVGGAIMAVISIYTGYYTHNGNRGRSFSLMALTVPLGALLGGMTVGLLVGNWGYRLMFAALTAVWLGVPAIGLFFLQEKTPNGSQQPKRGLDGKRLPLGSNFLLLLGASSLAALSIHMGRLGISLSMQALAFNARAIANSATVSGLAAIPVTLLMGLLSDRLGRRGFLGLTYIVAAAGALLLSLAQTVWLFWLASILLMVAFGVNRALSSALATDILDEGEFARGLSWVNTVAAAASIVSFASVGFLLDRLDRSPVFAVMAAIPILAAVLVGRVRPKRAAEPEISTPPATAVEGEPAAEKRPVELFWPVEGCM